MAKQSNKATWERLWQRRHRVFHYRNIIEIVEQLPLNLQRSSILEVGCGRGATLLEFARAGAFVTGVDYADSALAFCRELQAEAGELAEFVRADARDLPFEEERFDVVYSVGLLEHFEDPSPLLAEQYRVLKRGGYLIVQVPQKYSIYTVCKKALIAVNRWPYGGWETQFSRNELRTLAASTGLSPQFAYGYGSFTLAMLRHFLFSTLDHGRSGWHRDDAGFVSKTKANVSLDVGIVARKPVERLRAPAGKGTGRKTPYEARAV